MPLEPYLFGLHPEEEFIDFDDELIVQKLSQNVQYSTICESSVGARSCTGRARVGDVLLHGVWSPQTKVMECCGNNTECEIVQRIQMYKNY